MTRLWSAGERIQVEADSDGLPLRFTWRGVTHPVEGIANCWRVDVNWWKRRVWREHFKVYSSTGLLVTLYRDLVDDIWYLQRLYD